MLQVTLLKTLSRLISVNTQTIYNHRFQNYIYIIGYISPSKQAIELDKLRPILNCLLNSTIHLLEPFATGKLQIPPNDELLCIPLCEIITQNCRGGSKLLMIKPHVCDKVEML